jgi:hypothetical protein
MGWLEFIAAVVAICAWPAAILFIVLILRPKKKKENHHG